MVGVLPNSVLDSVNKSLRFDQALTKESFKSLQADKNDSLVLYFILVLLPAEQSGIFQKNCCKRNLVWVRSTGGGKVIFILLEEIMTSQVNFTLINV